VQAGAKRYVGSPLNDWRQENRKFGGAITVVAIQENDYVREICRGHTRQAGLPIAAARFVNNAGTQACGDLRRPIIRIAVNDDDFRREVRREIRQNERNRLRFVMSRDDDGHSVAIVIQVIATRSPPR